MKLKILSLLLIVSLYSCNRSSLLLEFDDPGIEKSIDSIFTRLSNDEIFNGEILVSIKGETIINKRYGKGDLITGSHFSDTSVFELASVSKPFTALAIAKLVSENVLSYDDTINMYLPELPYNNITVGNLVTHTSGLPDYNKVLYPVWDFSKIAGNHDLLKILEENPPELISSPGSKWQYSNSGYTLLAIIVERVQELSFPEYCKKHIFSPFGMTHTIIPSYDESNKNPAYVNDYIFSFGDAVYIDPITYPSYDNATFTGDMYGAQGICSNANDLSAFRKFFLEKEMLSDSVYSLFISPQGISNTAADDFTMGWFYDYDSILGESVFYVGGFAGHRSLLQFYLEQDITVVVLSNISTPIWSIKDIISKCLINETPEYPKKSFIKELSYQLQEIRNNEISLTNIIEFDSNLYSLKEYEFSELLEDLEARKEPELAIVACEKVFSIDTGNYKPLYYIGEIKYKSGKYKEAMDYYERALKLNPGDTVLISRIEKIREN